MDTAGKSSQREVFASARAAGQFLLDESSAKHLLAVYGVDVPRGMIVRESSRPGLNDLAAPLVAKVMSPDAIHKTDIGGVRLGLKDSEAALAAVKELVSMAKERGLRVDGVLVEEMAAAGIELVVGGITDARFGPVLMLGLGGVFVEVLQDTVFAVCPITRRDAAQMIEGLRGVSLLRGARGRSPINEDLLIDVLLAIGGDAGLLVELENEICELDINPLIVSEHTATACDARVLLRNSPGTRCV